MPLEPFLVNPPIRRRLGKSHFTSGRSLMAFGLNPRRKKRKASAKRKGKVPAHLIPFLFKKASASKGTARKRRKLIRRETSAQGATPMRHRKKHRKNPMVLGNPRRKHHRRSARRNPIVLGNPHRRHARRHSYRRNPAIIGKLGLPPMKEVLFLGLGAFAGRIAIPQVLARVPFLNSSPIIRGVSRLGMVAALGFLANKTLKANGKAFTLGLLANQIPEVANDFLSLTGVKLSDGNQELEMYTMPTMEVPVAPRTGLGLYTLSEGEESTI